MNTSILLQAAPSGGSQFMPLLLIVAMFVIMYFFMIRPQQKKQKEIRNFQNSLKVGDRVMLQSGIYGKVRRIDLTSGNIDVEIASGVTVCVNKAFVFADTTTAKDLGTNA